MGVVIRPRFGQPCFQCEATVPYARILIIEESAIAWQRSLLKSDIVCVDCERRAQRAEGPVEVTTTRPRRR